MKWILSDLDLTLTEPGENEIFYVTEPNNYDAAEAGALYESPKQHTVDLILQLQKEHKIIVLTARHDTCRADSEQWIKNHKIDALETHMRPAKDNSKTTIFKRKILDELIEKYGKPALILEDNEKNIAAFKDLNVPILNPNELITYEALSQATNAILGEIP